MPDQEEIPEDREVAIEWFVPESMVSQYATNMVIQHFEHEFVISFFDIKPPLIVGMPTKEQLENLTSVRAECIARIVVATARMPGFVEALQTNLEKWQSKHVPHEAVKE